MKILLFGSTGMVGQGVLRECLSAPDVTEVVAVVRRPSGQTHPKLRELVHDDFLDFSRLASDFAGVDACFFCLGVSSAGLSEAEYSRVTCDITQALAKVLSQASPGCTFVYLSGTGADSTEKGRSMWARVKGRAENALFATFEKSYTLRPAMIRPLDGIKSRTRWYAFFYAVTKPVLPLFGRLAPGSFTDTRRMGHAMLELVPEIRSS